MGCDIHGTVEKKVGGKWVMVNRWDSRWPCSERIYARFAALAGVRGDGPAPRGLPKDVSDSTALYVAERALDFHSSSWLSLAEAIRVFVNTDPAPITRKLNFPESHFWNIELAAPQDRRKYRIVFWFDN